MIQTAPGFMDNDVIIIVDGYIDDAYNIYDERIPSTQRNVFIATHEATEIIVSPPIYSSKTDTSLRSIYEPQHNEIYFNAN